MAKQPKDTKETAKSATKSAARSASQTVVWVILLLVVVGLGGFGAVNFSGSVRSVGTVGDTPIPVTRYQRQLNQDLQQLRQQTGMNIGIQQAEAFGIDRAALSKVVQQVALENEAKRVGVSAGDEIVQQRLMAIGSFQGFDGKFDAQAYRDILKRSGIGVAEFEDELRASAARTVLVDAVEAGAKMPETQTEAIYQWAAQRRDFVWAELSVDDLSDPVPAPADADLQAWYKDHPKPYTTPETRKITYAWITPTMLVDKIDVDEQALRNLYDQRADQYNIPEKRLVERLVFGSQYEAQAAWDRLQSGDVTFEALVKERGLSLDDIDMGDVSKDDLGAAGDAVFALKEPGLVGPVQTDLGPAILRMNGILDAQVTPFEDVRDELKQDLATDRASRQIQDMSEHVNDILAGGGTLEDLAKETDLELGHIDFTADSNEGIAGYAAFRKAAQAVTKDDFPTATGLDDGGLFALRLDEVVAPAVKPYDAVADQVEKDWKANATTEALNSLADELIPRLNAGEAPSSFGLDVNHIDGVTRDAYLADVPEGLVDKAFALDEGQAGRIPGTPGTQTVALVQTTAILPPDPENTDMTASRGKFAQQLDDQLAQDIAEAYTRAVQSRAGVKIDQSAVNAVNAQFQ